MKRFWLVLLSLGLIAAFSTQALAVDVKFSGEYFAAGMYQDRVGVNETATWRFDPASPLLPPLDVLPGDTSTAFYYQRLRLTTTFIVHPGLYFITRADVMERAWAAARFNPNGRVGALDDRSAGTRAENENIAFDLAYVQYVSPIGIFLAGYQIDGAWGTTFGDTSMPTPKIGYMLPIPGVQGLILGLQTGKTRTASAAGAPGTALSRMVLRIVTTTSIQRLSDTRPKVSKQEYCSSISAMPRPGTSLEKIQHSPPSPTLALKHSNLS
ncbi:MAG: hypothetical protein WBI25_05460 [Smithellaceae bacterium]